MNYIIQEANDKQIDYISNMFYRNPPKWQENRNNYYFYIAIDKESTIIGYIIIEEKDIPVLPYGKDWFIVTIKVLEKYRRRGVGTALIQYALQKAQELGILNIQGAANPTVEAHMFWLKNKFSFFKYGKQHNDITKKSEYGNYSHIIFRRVDVSNINIKDNYWLSQYTFDMASQEELNNLFCSYKEIEKKCSDIYQVDRSQIKGIIVSNKQGENIGFITWIETGLVPPLKGVQWCIPCLHVNVEYMNKGVSRFLILELIRVAKSNNVQQLFSFCHNEEMMEYWYNLGFDVFLFRYLFHAKTGNNPLAIGF